MFVSNLDDIYRGIPILFGAMIGKGTLIE